MKMYDFKNFLDKFFIFFFFNKSIVPNHFHKTVKFQDILPRSKYVENSKKWLSLRLFVAMATVRNILI